MSKMRGSILARVVVILSVVFALLLSAWPVHNLRGAALADYPDQGKRHGKGNRHLDRDDEAEQDENRDEENDRKRDRDHTRIRPIFEVQERDVVRDYFRNRYSNLPPGLAKRGGHLPPGLERHLERNGTLPPGLQKRLTPFPDDLNRRLPSLPSIYRRGTIGRDAVIVNTRTGRVIDIIRDVLYP